MGTEILRPQDCLIERIRVRPASFSRRKSYYYGSPIANQNYVSNPRSRKPAVRSESRRIQVQPADAAPVAKTSSSHDDLRSFKMEKVTILRRGESLDSKMNEKGGLAGTGTGTARLRPGPETVQKQVRIVDLRSPVGGKTDMYAGSAFAVSPEPSSLPLPSFSRKKQVSKVVDDDSATRDLRRLLRLD
ncbi:hypothetical protein D8674_009763 [Pyrus ussuriensis x Pyrus communis]|uniref:Uncharacterized protein n=1 Tax=Pyrus ussuriensis x Pyrus communis TaxID=2448454 RepID=A0A5N5FE43_9ROSA|nr:hypothetical protein D8674_009763 [Pyrus ussuriensis x Pyrus communis]